MTRLALGLALSASLLTGCKKSRVPRECEVFLRTIDKVSACDKIPADARKPFVDSAKTIKDSLQMLEDAGGDVPPDLLNSMKDICKTQEASVRQMYEKVAPDCLK